jgi:hypothetical protein
VSCIFRCIGIGDDQFIITTRLVWMMQTHKLLILMLDNAPLRDALPRYLPIIVSSVTSARATL